MPPPQTLVPYTQPQSQPWVEWAGQQWPTAAPVVVPLAKSAFSAAGKRARDFLSEAASSRIYPSKSRERKRTRRTMGPKVNVDGTSAGAKGRFKSKKSRKKRKKKTLADKVSKLKALIPRQSTKTNIDYKCMVMSGQGNERKFFEILCLDGGLYEQVADGLTNVDSTGTANYTTTNTTFKISAFYRLYVKNNSTANIKFEYAFIKCKDDDSQSYQDQLLKDLGARGYTGLPTILPEQSADATNSLRPQELNFGSVTPYHCPVWSGVMVNRKWDKIGPVKTISIGPGATSSLVHSLKTNWKPEIGDAEPGQKRAGFAIKLLICMTGDLAHDQTNTNLVGRSGYQVDAEEQRNIKVTYMNPKQLHEIDYTDTLTDTNFTIPVHADNMASAIEQADN